VHLQERAAKKRSMTHPNQAPNAFLVVRLQTLEQQGEGIYKKLLLRLLSLGITASL
jgi:hypothetical protein